MNSSRPAPWNSGHPRVSGKPGTVHFQCLAGADTTGEPGALLRGGNFDDGSDAGPLDVVGNFEPSFANGSFGFRCAR